MPWCLVSSIVAKHGRSWDDTLAMLRKHDVLIRISIGGALLCDEEHADLVLSRAATWTEASLSAIRALMADDGLPHSARHVIEMLHRHRQYQEITYPLLLQLIHRGVMTVLQQGSPRSPRYKMTLLAALIGIERYRCGG